MIIVTTTRPTAVASADPAEPREAEQQHRQEQRHDGQEVAPLQQQAAVADHEQQLGQVQQQHVAERCGEQGGGDREARDAAGG